MNPDIQATIDKANSQVAGINKTAGTSIPVITATGLQQAPAPLQIPPPPASTAAPALQGAISSTNDGFTQQLANATSSAKTNTDTSLQSLISALSSGGQAEYTDQAYKDNGVDTAQSSLSDANNAITTEQVSLQHRVDALKKNPQGFVGNALQNEIDRITNESLSKQADLSVVQLAKQGQYDSAKAIADRAVAAQTEAQQNKIQALQAIYEANKDEFSTAEQQQFESAQAQRNSELDTKKQMLLADYDAKIKQNDPLYQAQLANAKAAGGAGYDGQFAATIQLAANANKNATNATRADVAQALQGSLANGDYKSAYQTIIQQTKAGLTGTTATRFENAAILGNTLNDLQTALQAYSDAGGKTNLLTGTEDQIQTKIGALQTDPKYADLAVQLDTAYQNYRLMLTGANFSSAEASAYASVLPSKNNTLALNLAKIQGAKAAADTTVEGAIRNVVGDGGIYIKQYAEGATPPSSGAGDTSTDDYSSERTQLQEGEVLVNRNGQIGAVPADEFNPETDIRL